MDADSLGERTGEVLIAETVGGSHAGAGEMGS